MPQLTFTVDSALLRELGERLVGKPHIALAELVKNAYDADATEVVIKFGDDILTVEDNGHGMTESEFESFWMRIGSPHKEKLRTSRELGRPLTGSKGVGRLAAQFLARELELITATGPEDLGLAATVDWTRAIAAGDLTNAAVDYVTFDRPEDFIGGSAHGTRLVWSSKALIRLGPRIDSRTSRARFGRCNHPLAPDLRTALPSQFGWRPLIRRLSAASMLRWAPFLNSGMRGSSACRLPTLKQGPAPTFFAFHLSLTIAPNAKPIFESPIAIWLRFDSRYVSSAFEAANHTGFAWTKRAHT
jgi:hypothetical protein